ASTPFPGTGNVSAYGAGSLWQVDHDLVDRIDPRTGRIVSIPVARVSAIAFGDGALWVATSPRSSSSTLYEPVGRGSVLRIDPATNRVVGNRVPFGITPAYLAAGYGSAWVGDYNSSTLTHVTVAPPSPAVPATVWAK